MYDIINDNNEPRGIDWVTVIAVLIVILIGVGVSYLIGAFCTQSFDVTSWSKIERLILSIASIVWTTLVLAAAANNES